MHLFKLHSYKGICGPGRAVLRTEISLCARTNIYILHGKKAGSCILYGPLVLTQYKRIHRLSQLCTEWTQDFAKQFGRDTQMVMQNTTGNLWFFWEALPTEPMAWGILPEEGAPSKGRPRLHDSKSLLWSRSCLSPAKSDSKKQSQVWNNK